MNELYSLSSVAEQFGMSEDEAIKMIKDNHHIFANCVHGLDMSDCADAELALNEYMATHKDEIEAVINYVDSKLPVYDLRVVANLLKITWRDIRAAIKKFPSSKKHIRGRYFINSVGHLVMLINDVDHNASEAPELVKAVQIHYTEEMMVAMRAEEKAKSERYVLEAINSGILESTEGIIKLSQKGLVFAIDILTQLYINEMHPELKGTKIPPERFHMLLFEMQEAGIMSVVNVKGVGDCACPSEEGIAKFMKLISIGVLSGVEI